MLFTPLNVSLVFVVKYLTDILRKSATQFDFKSQITFKPMHGVCNCVCSRNSCDVVCVIVCSCSSHSRHWVTYISLRPKSKTLV